MLASQSQAVLVDFVGPCDYAPFAAKMLPGGAGQSVADLTKVAAVERNIPMNITKQGMFEFLGDAMNPKATTKEEGTEIGFGWCYLVNGHPAKASATDYKPAQSDRITWVHTYAVKILGQWQADASCIPTYEKYSQLFCSK